MLWRQRLTTHKMGNVQRTSYQYQFSFVAMTLQADALFNIIHSTMGDRKVPRTEEAGAALHMLSALHWSYNAHKLFCVHKYFCQNFCCCWQDHPGVRFLLLASAWWLWTIENRSCLVRMWHIRAGTKPNATIGQLVKTQMLIGCGTTKPLVNTPQKVPQTTFAVVADVNQSQPHAFSQHKKLFFLQRSIFWASRTAEWSAVKQNKFRQNDWWVQVLDPMDHLPSSKHCLFSSFYYPFFKLRSATSLIPSQVRTFPLPDLSQSDPMDH